VFEPKILGILCHWCSYTGADSAGQARLSYPPNVRVLHVMCSSRVPPALVLEAFSQGADGVLICGCHPGDCHYINGNYKALARFRLLERLLTGMGVERERIRLEWVSASEGERFAALVAEMTGTLRELGPCTWQGPSAAFAPSPPHAPSP